MANTVFYEAKAGLEATIVLFNRSGLILAEPLREQTYIGRSASLNGCSIRIDSPIVSRSHGEIVRMNDGYYYRDLGSTNGTYINNKHIGKGSPAARQASLLSEGDVLLFDAPVDGEHHPDCVFALFTYASEATGKWNEIKLDCSIAEICIGRAAQNGIQIKNNMISEKHASFFCSENGWAIIDHKSTNGVFLNTKRLTSPRYLKAFDVVRIADTHFVFTGDRIIYSGKAFYEQMPCGEIPVIENEYNQNNQIERIPPKSTAPKGGELVISIIERSAVQRFRKMMLLQNINITVSKGEMVLILGGSGAGKTTFINAVMGYEKAVGKITYDDTDIYEEYEKMKYEIGFVPQQDLLRGSDTVYDTLSNAAEMKLLKSVDAEEREKRISSVLEELGLSRERDSLVTKLSGGQRKRLSIAVEFIADPGLFFLDEPDSGVDDIMGRGLMESLRAIADKGKIVMVITHSPERAADLFDKVIVLAKSAVDNCGHLAFYGNVKEAFSFFEVKSFREIVKKINRPDENGEGLSDFFIEKYNEYAKRQNI